MKKRIRPISVFYRHHLHILVYQGFDSSKNQTFYRPLGGCIEFEESSLEALHREIKEELQAEIHSPVFLGVLKNRLNYENESGHEIVFVYDAIFSDTSLYSNSELEVNKASNIHSAVWLPINRLPQNTRLYPPDLLALIQQPSIKKR